MNLLCEGVGAFTEESKNVARLFAAHAAVAMVRAEEQARLRTAIGACDLMGQAKGILMECFKINVDQAFSVLTRVSQTSNRK